MSKTERSIASQNFRPRLKLDRVLRPIHRFMDTEASGGIVLLIATLAALFLANTSLVNWYGEFWQQKVSFHLGGINLDKTYLETINDGLMTLFFFLVGLEIKREITFGDLSSPRDALMPLIGAVGGMLIPALLYITIEHSGPAKHGWAVPMATDIAFVVGFLSLLGKRVPKELKIFLLTLAIADDIGAVLVIALVYAKNFSAEYFAAGMIVYIAIFVLKYLGARRLSIYAILGFVMWYYILKSGVHPTIAGVLLGLATPARSLVSRGQLGAFLTKYLEILHLSSGRAIDQSPLRDLSREALAPAERIESDLHPWVAFLILPLFALANAGVPVQLSALENSVTWAVVLGLVVGKPLGIFAACYAADYSGLVKLPSRVTPKILFAASCLGGVGFTMSIFLSDLAFDSDLLVFGKVGTLVASVISASIGLLLLHRFLDRRELPEEQPEPA